MHRSLVLIFLFLIGLPAESPLAASSGELVGYYVGRDGRATFPTGTYAGLANPNFGRLTLLYNHGDHFHGMGTYSYTGPAGSPTTLDTSTNNRLPEVSSLQPPLPLSPGAGPLYGDKLVSQHSALEYSDLTLNSMDALAGGDPGSEAAILFNSSGGRWNGSMAGSQVGLQLVSITPGLSVGSPDTLNLFENGNTYDLGSGSSLDLSLVFWTAANAAPGKYSAEFRLIDVGSGGAGDSGRFFIDVAPVPVPAAVWLFGSALGAIGVFGRRRTTAV